MRFGAGSAALGAFLFGALVANPQARPVPAAPQQTRPPVFRGTADLIEIDAVVTDKSGAIVRGLSRDDFQIAEDGKPQELVEFSFVDIPVPSSAAPTRPVALEVKSDVSSNAKPTDRRLYVIVLDGFHVDSTRSTIVRKLAKQFIDGSMGPTDLAAVLILGKNAANQQFTSNKPLLDATVEQFIGQKSQSATLNAQVDAYGRSTKMESVPEDAEAGAKASQARIALESIKQVCERLGTSQGFRRSVVLFAEGIEVDTSDLIGEDKRPAAGGQGLKYESAKHAGDILQAEQDMFDAARRANVAIYTIDPRGNSSGDELSMQVGSAAFDPLTSRPAAASPTTDMMKEAQRGQGTLRTFAEQTGGLAVVNTTNFAAGFTQVVQANSSYYVLGYAPPVIAHDGAFHKIAVSLKRPNLDVTARKGYYAPVDMKPGAVAPTPDSTKASAPVSPSPNAASPRMRELLASSLPVSGLGLRVTGGPIRNQGNKVLVALVVEIDTKNLPFAEQNGLLANDIEMAFLAMDAQGKMQAASRQVGNLRLPPDQRAAVANGLRYVVEFPVVPGRYQVRVAAHESTGDAGGSALLDVDAPAFDKTPLSMGTVLITVPAVQAAPTTGNFPTIKTLLLTPPTALREFTPHDTLAALINVLGSDARRGVTGVTTVIRTEAGQEISRTVAQFGASDLIADRSGYSHVVQIPLTSLPAGRYVVTFNASATSGKTTSQSVPFLVR